MVVHVRFVLVLQVVPVTVVLGACLHVSQRMRASKLAVDVHCPKPHHLLKKSPRTYKSFIKLNNVPLIFYDHIYLVGCVEDTTRFISIIRCRASTNARGGQGVNVEPPNLARVCVRSKEISVGRPSVNSVELAVNVRITNSTYYGPSLRNGSKQCI